MTTYVYLLYGDESRWDNASQEVWDAEMAKHGEFSAWVEARGSKILGGEALDQTRTATTLRFEDGKDTLVTDGPFAEVAENLGGYYVIECKDLDEALEVGKRMPMTGGGSVEIRPVVPTGGS
ncbi:MAG TPA: YciI family protein [Acidothermales bacterium]|jgi:hypothetical protein